MHIAICDDDTNDLKQTENTVKKVLGEMKINYCLTVFNDINKLLDTKNKYELIFLDIELNNPDINGVQAAKMIKRHTPDCMIIFTTNYEEYIDEVIEKYAFRYWSKPIDEYRLRKSLLALIDSKRTLVFEEYYTKQKTEVPFRNIIYITTECKKCKIITTSGQYLVNESFKTIREKFTQNDFCDCHGSYCVNINFIEKYNKTEVYLKHNNTQYKVHMSRRHYKLFKEMMFIVGGDSI